MHQVSKLTTARNLCTVGSSCPCPSLTYMDEKYLVGGNMQTIWRGWCHYSLDNTIKQVLQNSPIESGTINNLEMI